MPCKTIQTLNLSSEIMTEKESIKDSKLVPVLRESIGVVQMVLFKELKRIFAVSYSDRSNSYQSRLAGAIINKVFGMENPDPQFQEFNRTNHAVIEQELLGMAKQLPELMSILTDALRVMVLCDSQQDEDTGEVLIMAQQLGILVIDRETPLPSTFMTLVRRLGEKHGLTIAPVENLPEMDSSGPH
jgi:hypothetical protein